MSKVNIEDYIVRYGDLQPCRTAFIDAHTPGSDQKENFTIIGKGVSESPDQHIHIRDTPGFNIGAAGQPPKCKNSLHFHTTAEVFFILSGRWRFFWGRYGDAGEVVCEAGDIFNIPTQIFRGFENIGNDYGMIMSILGGDDTGGVTWAPEVLESAQAHGLVLGEDSVLYDTKKGETLPSGIKSMPALSEAELNLLRPDPSAKDVVQNYIGRYWDMMAAAKNQPCKVIGEHAMIRDKPGFEVDFLTRGSMSDALYRNHDYEVLMVKTGHWNIEWDGQTRSLAPGDVCMLPPNSLHRMYPSMSGQAALFRVTKTNDPAGDTWVPN